MGLSRRKFTKEIADSEGWRSAFRTDVDHDSNLMPITVPNYNRKTDRLQFRTLIGITSES